MAPSRPKRSKRPNKSKRSKKPRPSNPRAGGSLRDFFEELGEWDEVEKLARRKTLLYRVVERMSARVPQTPEDRVWLEILRRDEHLSRLPPPAAARRLRSCGFPAKLVEDYLAGRSAAGAPVPCNLCGLPCTLGAGTPAEGQYGLVRASVLGGFPSTPGVAERGEDAGALDDGCSYTFSLCEHCLDWLFSRFRVPVRVVEEILPTRTAEWREGDPEPWAPASDRIEADERRSAKAAYHAERERREAARGPARPRCLGPPTAPSFKCRGPDHGEMEEVVGYVCATRGCDNYLMPGRLSERLEKTSHWRGVWASRGLRYSLRLIREAVDMTSARVAQMSGMTLEDVERVESLGAVDVPAGASRDEVRRYVKAIGGRLRVFVDVSGRYAGGRCYELALRDEESSPGLVQDPSRPTEESR